MTKLAGPPIVALPVSLTSTFYDTRSLAFLREQPLRALQNAQSAWLFVQKNVQCGALCFVFVSTVHLFPLLNVTAPKCPKEPQQLVVFKVLLRTYFDTSSFENLPFSVLNNEQATII